MESLINSSIYHTILDNITSYDDMLAPYDEDITNIEVTQHVSDIPRTIVSILMPAICVFGILGNTLNLVILTHRHLNINMDRLEKSSLLGLIALAISDGSYCICALPRSFIRISSVQQATVSSLLCLYYRAYHGAAINTFCFASTWLTVIMACSRFFAICYPLHARSFISYKSTKISVASVLVVALVVNLPRFWIKRVSDVPCRHDANVTCYSLVEGSLQTHSELFNVYMAAWALIGVFFPLLLVTFFSICLIRALQRSRQLQKLYRANLPPTNTSDHITPTLIAIVVLFLLLTCPSEIFSVVMMLRGPQNVNNVTDRRNEIIAMISNTLLTTNFAINFILYFFVNLQFRKIVKHLICCQNPQPMTMRRYHTSGVGSNMTTYIFNMSIGDADL